MDVHVVASILICLAAGAWLGAGSLSGSEVRQRGRALAWLPFAHTLPLGLFANLLANIAVFLALPALACVLARRGLAWFEFIGIAWLAGAALGKLLRFLWWRARSPSAFGR